MRLSIKHSVKLALAIGAAALGVAGCGGGDEESAGAAGASTGLVSVAMVDGTDVLADSGGRTLYTTPVEEGGKILCVDACTTFWQPLEASPDDADAAAEALNADLGVVDRPDGDRQLTLDGLPLYTFTEEGPGQLEGDGFVDDFQGTTFEWEAARRESAPAPNAPSDGAGGGY